MEEGDYCVEDNCNGRYLFQPDGECTCHISPPCAACVGSRLVCSNCGTNAPEHGLLEGLFELALLVSGFRTEAQ